jgi:hypothetical protein
MNTTKRTTGMRNGRIKDKICRSERNEQYFQQRSDYCPKIAANRRIGLHAPGIESRRRRNSEQCDSEFINLDGVNGTFPSCDEGKKVIPMKTAITRYRFHQDAHPTGLGTKFRLFREWMRSLLITRTLTTFFPGRDFHPGTWGEERIDKVLLGGFDR